MFKEISERGSQELLILYRHKMTVTCLAEKVSNFISLVTMVYTKNLHFLLAQVTASFLPSVHLHILRLRNTVYRLQLSVSSIRQEPPLSLKLLAPPHAISTSHSRSFRLRKISLDAFRSQSLLPVHIPLAPICSLALQQNRMMHMTKVS